MAELLIANFTNQRHDRGDIVDVRANDAVYGTKEALPLFLIAKIPALTIADLDQYSDRWIRSADVTPSYTLASDMYSLIISSVNANIANRLTSQEFQSKIANWNMGIVDNGDGTLTLAGTGFDMMTSPAFFDRYSFPVGYVFALNNHDQVTGDNTIQLSYPVDAQATPTQVERRIIAMGAVVVSHSNRVIVYTLDQATLRQKFRSEVLPKLNKLVSVCRYKLSAAACNNIESQGGVGTSTPTQFQNNLIDKAAI